MLIQVHLVVRLYELSQQWYTTKIVKVKVMTKAAIAKITNVL